MTSSTLIVVLSILLFQAVSAKSVDTAREDTKGETERIISGQTARQGQFPFATALFFNGQFICTSSIISPTTVLTAAHCVAIHGDIQPAGSFHAIAHVNNKSPSVRIDFADARIHPKYNSTNLNNDIAVLTTIEPIPISDDVRPICIARPETDLYEYKKATAMGWGKTNREWQSDNFPDELQYVYQKIINNKICSFLNEGINDDKICAKGLFNGICEGDSGGPLVYETSDNEYVQVGLASYINSRFGCGKAYPAVWTRVSSHYDFIMESVDDPDSICVI